MTEHKAWSVQSGLNQTTCVSIFNSYGYGIAVSLDRDEALNLIAEIARALDLSSYSTFRTEFERIMECGNRSLQALLDSLES